MEYISSVHNYINRNTNFTLNTSKILFIYLFATLTVFITGFISETYTYVTPFLIIGILTSLLTEGNDYVTESVVLSLIYSISIFLIGNIVFVVSSNLVLNALLAYSFSIAPVSSYITKELSRFIQKNYIVEDEENSNRD